MLLSSACMLLSPPPPPPPPPPNQTPIIDSLAAEKEVLTTSESQVTCKATDADGDTLTYRWSTDGGTIKGEGNSITWVAPDIPDDYTVKVAVIDGKGGEAIKSTTITVTARPNHPPVIIKLTKDGNPPDDENRAREWTTTTIQCTAEDPDGDKLSYLWRATGGKITGGSNTVGWTAPGVKGEYTVTVIATDGRGGQAEKSITFTVLCCGR
jgi:hypothetical protein